MANNIEESFWIGTGILNPVVDLFTQPLSDFLCLETARHATTWKRYGKIRTYGAIPSFGGTGACVGFQMTARDSSTIEKASKYMENSKDFFFANRDSTAGTDFEGNTIDVFKKCDIDGVSNLGMGMTTSKSLSFFHKVKRYLFIHYGPRFYAWKAGYAENASPEVKGTLEKVKRIASGVLNLFAPTVKLRFRPEDLKDYFIDDPLLLGSAMKTQRKIGTEHLGLKGIFLQGCNGHIVDRIKNNPGKALWGLARLINPIGLTLLAAAFIYNITQPINEHLVLNKV